MRALAVSSASRSPLRRAPPNAAKTPRVQPPELVAHHGSTTLEGTDERDRL
ncbi:MAG: hypothetical protein ACRDHM_09585 [Actinomycetota bacterium]